MGETLNVNIPQSCKVSARGPWAVTLIASSLFLFQERPLFLHFSLLQSRGASPIGVFFVLLIFGCFSTTIYYWVKLFTYLFIYLSFRVTNTYNAMCAQNVTISRGTEIRSMLRKHTVQLRKILNKYLYNQLLNFPRKDEESRMVRAQQSKHNPRVTT